MTHRAKAASVGLTLYALGACLLAGCGQKDNGQDAAYNAQAKKAFTTTTDPATITDDQLNKVPPQYRDMVRAKRDAARKGEVASPAPGPPAH
jgi:hypothetical protein